MMRLLSICLLVLVAGCQDYGARSKVPSCTDSCQGACFGDHCEQPVALSASNGGTCALFSGGSVKCWGGNPKGELGNGTISPWSRPVTVSGLTDAVAIATSHHSCAVRANGAVVCWGEDLDHELGSGKPQIEDSAVPVPVAGVQDAVGVAVGLGYTCVLLSNGTVTCWGWNDRGQLGDGTTTDRATPGLVPNLTGVTAITAGEYYTCALLEDRTVSCWGGGTGEQVEPARSLTPMRVEGLADVVAISASMGLLCAAIADGTVQCAVAPPLQPVAGFNRAVAVSAGMIFACAVDDGVVKCWGDGGYGQLGTGQSSNSATPVPVVGLSEVRAITTSDHHACAALNDGTVWCWGENESGELGFEAPIVNNLPANSYSPVKVVW